MACILLILELFFGLFIIFATGRLISYIFKLDDYLNNNPDYHPNLQA